MIEVEKKFLLNEDDITRLTNGAEFLKERVFTDTYYDTPSFSLTTKDIWLRARDNRFELKLPLHKGVDRLADQYEELEDEEKIRTALGLAKQGSFSDDLKENNYTPFCSLTTTRKKFKKDDFNIDLDTVTGFNFDYKIGEIELMVNNASEIDTTINKIIAFAKEKNLKTTTVRGKVLEFLKQKSPNHYQALLKAGVIKDF